MPTTWRKLISIEMEENKDSWEKLVCVSPENLDFDKIFNESWGTINGDPFTMWTEHYVYFPVSYDGAEWVSSVPRNPNGKITEHV